MKFILNTCLLIVILLCRMTQSAAQNDTSFPIRYSPEQGAYLYFANQALSPQQPYENMAGVRISRQKGKTSKELVKLARPNSVAEFKRICGEKSWSQFLLMKNFRTDEDGWKFILSHPVMDDYGTLAFDMRFRQAMGNAFLDSEAANLPAGKQWTYRIEILDPGGNVTGTFLGTVTGTVDGFQFEKPRKGRLMATDSAVFMHWFVLSGSPSPGIIMADVYRQDGGIGIYRKLSSPLLAATKGDSTLFYLADEVDPGSLYRYFIRPTDEWGNAAQPSDTISVLSVDFASLPSIEQVRARDTLNAIQLSWKPLGDLPQLVGIEIQRSRDARGNYIVLDTVAVSESSYHDLRVLPAIAYFYRLRVIPLKGMERQTGYSGYVNASVKNVLKNPDPPYNLTGNLEKGKVILHWEAIDDLDLYGYFVYRSTSHNGRFEVISSSLTTTSFVDTSRISGRTQYVYAVKAVNKNSLESEFSNLVTMRQPIAELPSSPGGLHAYADNRKIILKWPAVNAIDHAVAGYNVYRREAQAKGDYDLKLSAAAQATKLKFTLLNSALVVQPHFEDVAAVAGINYEYAVASVDVFGLEGSYSPFAKIFLPVNTRVISTCTLRKVATGVELGWESEMAAGADAIVIYRKKSGDPKFQKIASVSKSNVNFIDKTVQKNTLYIYLISAEKNSAPLAKSEEKNFQF